MALKLDINFKALPLYGKILISCIPALIIVIAGYLIFISPARKEIKAIEVKIAAQENEIAKNQAKAEKLPELTLENEKLRKRLNDLKQQLPEEKEISSLLQQVSDLCIRSGLKVALWRPEQKKTHPSGIVYEIPVKVELLGSYHSLGYFFSSLTKLTRIVNISDIRLSDPKPEKVSADVRISFNATTFSAVEEADPTKKDNTPLQAKGRAK